MIKYRINTPSHVWFITSWCLDIRRDTHSHMKHSFWSRAWYISRLNVKWNTPSRVSFITSWYLDIKWNTLPRVWISNETLLVFDMSLLSVWISNKTRSRVWISNKTLLLVFGYQIKHSFSCLDVKWNTPSRVWYITFRCLDFKWNLPSCVTCSFALWCNLHLHCYRDPYKHSTCHCEFEYPPTSPRALVLVV